MYKNNQKWFDMQILTDIQKQKIVELQQKQSSKTSSNARSAAFVSSGLQYDDTDEQIPESLREIIISKGIDIEHLPKETQIKVAHIVLDLWLKFEDEVITNITNEKVQLHWRLFIKSQFNTKLLEVYPELTPLISSITLKFIQN